MNQFVPSTLSLTLLYERIITMYYTYEEYVNESFYEV